jgi:type IV pilus assembly protein PilV
MMGIAALHGQSLGAARTAQYRSLAIILASDMADRIRLNRVGQAAYLGAAVDEPCDPPATTACTPAQIAAYDRFVWNQEVAQRLPSGTTGLIFNGATIPPTYTIQVNWVEVGAGAQQYQLVFQQPAF